MGHSKQVTKLMILPTLFIVRSIDMTHMSIVYLFLLFNKNKRTNEQRHSNIKAKVRLILGLLFFIDLKITSCPYQYFSLKFGHAIAFGPIVL